MPRRRSSRERLIEAALAEFSERGFEAATVGGIADRAGVTTGALYAHFRGKLDLLLQALGIVPASVLYRELTEAASQPWSNVGPLLSEGMAADPEPSALLLLDAIVAARRDPAVARVLRDGLSAYEDAMAKATQVGVALGFIHPALGADDLARVMNVLAFGRLVIAALGASAPSPAAYERLAELLLQTSGAPPRRASALGRVAACAQVDAAARQDLIESVVAAVDAGHSLREVGAAAGLSHERVRQAVRARPALHHSSVT